MAGRELLWQGDPAHWSGRAPILFPVIGASAGGEVRVDGQAYPMPQHGFARDSHFEVVERSEASARFRLADSAETRRHYPFAFALDVLATLGPEALTYAFGIRNTGDVALPYALGFHPAFPWPFAAEDRAGHAVLFEAAEEPLLPAIRPDGTFEPNGRSAPLEGSRLPLTPDLFARGALVFLDAQSRSMRFAAPSGAAIGLEAENFPHLAVWTRPTAPFVSLEAWTGHADWGGFAGELRERGSMRMLEPGAVGRHAVTLSWHPA